MLVGCTICPSIITKGTLPFWAIAAVTQTKTQSVASHAPARGKNPKGSCLD
jgi:hypothetical protein